MGILLRLTSQKVPTSIGMVSDAEARRLVRLRQLAMKVTRAASTVVLALFVLCVLATLTTGAESPPRVAWLGGDAEAGHFFDAFRQGLRDLGYIEGQNIIIEARSSERRPERYPDLAAELVRLKVSVIVAASPPALRAVARATRTIPIVMRVSDDPAAGGIVTSLAHPSGNITGLYSLSAELSAKRLELLKQALPRITRVAVLMDSTNRGSKTWFTETVTAAHTLAIQLQPVEARSVDELEGAFRAAVDGRAEALITLRNPLIVRRRTQIVRLAERYRIPTMFDERQFVEEGGLMAYGTNLVELYRRAAYFVDKILKGAKPGDLPVEQPTRFEFVVNRKTAETLGLTISQAVLQRVDQVIP